MTGLTIPIIITVVAIIAAFSAYRGIRRGGARFYTLEREAMLRRASFTLLASIFLFLGAIGLMTYNLQQMTAESTTEETVEEGSGPATATPEPVIEGFPPTATVTSTPDPNVPTATATVAICRAIVDGTAGGGLTLRTTPGGEEVVILPDGTIVNLLPTEPQVVNGVTWRNIRTVAREEGWVSEEFLTIGDCG